MKFLVKEWPPSVIDMDMNEIGHYPLLSAQEEIELASQYERGRTAECQIGSRAPGTPERAQLEAAVVRGRQARQQLIECNLRIARFFPWKRPSEMS